MALTGCLPVPITLGHRSVSTCLLQPLMTSHRFVVMPGQTSGSTRRSSQAFALMVANLWWESLWLRLPDGESALTIGDSVARSTVGGWEGQRIYLR